MSTTKDHSRKVISRGTSYRFDEFGPVFTAWGKTTNLQRTRTGVSVPKWREKIRDHQDATSGLDGTFCSRDITGFVGAELTYHYDLGGIGYKPAATLRKEWFNGDLSSFRQNFPSTNSNSTWDSDVIGRAANRFLSDVRKTVTSMSAPTFLGELKQTLHMLRHPMEALGQSCDRYYKELRKRKLDEQRRRRRKGLPELPKDSPKWEWLYAIPGLWLEHSFGWMPLLMDINDALDTLDHLTDKVRTVKLSKGASGAKLISQASGSGGVSGLNRIKIGFTDRTKEQTTCRYRGEVVAQAATTYAEKGARWGFTPSEFLPTAWELLPWSFLVDYFASIGDYLDSSFADTSALKWSCRTLRRARTNEYLSWVDKEASEAGIPASGLPTCSVIEGPALALSKRKIIQRDPGQVPQPSVTYTFWDGQSSKHLANMSALFGGAMVNLHTQNPIGKFNFRR